MTLVWPVGIILPVAEATMSIWPRKAHNSAMQNSAMMVNATVRPSGEGGVSTISRAAGRNAISSRSRPLLSRGNCNTFWISFCETCLTDFMNASLYPVEHGVAPARIDEFVVGAVFHQPAAIDRQDAVGAAHGGEA